ncbi:3-isopropylmalate dehydratase small subunit [Sphingomonas montanisoli]|uniref:3-isopropylmalate dehydratase n=1 Tax=Sphingomonas montanisoli TaxID=2606412 RepID=A0A5D9CD98_9SPHN|nr:3-isopropylmalate dehydratase small subunit [Sphingomonas montanisoli]TZG29223.1 3-isopropylmalate dehydratase small subunit [Sphingomonas montanisoli]
MKPFTTLEAPALALIEDRIDTDVLFPARFLLIMEKDGLGRYLCYDRRFDAQDQPVDNPVDPALAAGAGIVLAGREFGCGSSREQAVWALAGAGITCVVAESFGEIFAANCLRNGVLAIRLGREAIGQLADAAAQGALSVDLPTQRVGRGDISIAFDIDAPAKERLLNGWDEIDTIMARATTDIDGFEAAQRRAQPWLY